MAGEEREGMGKEGEALPHFFFLQFNCTEYLVGGVTHQLFGVGSPDGGHGDDPAHVLVDNDGGGLGGQFLERVLLEVAQGEREQLNGRELFAVAGRDRRLAVQLLHHTMIDVIRDCRLPFGIPDVKVSVLPSAKRNFS